MSQLKKGVMLSYINIFLTNIIGLVLTPFIIRSLGDSEYGLYTLIGSFVTYLTLMDLGLNNTIIRFVAQYRAENDKAGEQIFLGTSLKIYSAISVVLTIIGIVIYFNLETIFNKSLTIVELEKAKIMFIILVFDIAIALPGGTFTAICNAYENFVFPRTLSIVRYIVRAMTILTVLLYGGKAISLVVIDTILNLIMVSATIFFVFRHLKIKFNFGKADNGLVKRIYNYSVWVFLLGIVSQFFWNTGQFILGIQTNTKTIAIYAVGIMLGGYYGAFAGAINSVFLPKATKMSIENTDQELSETMTRVGRITFVILMFILVPFFLFGREFILLWVGPTYLDSWLIALIIMIVYTIPLIQNFAHSLIEAKNIVRQKVIIYVLFISLGIAAGWFLASSYGGLGMAIGICSGWLIAQLILNFVFIKVLRLNIVFFLKEIFLSPLAICILSVLVISSLLNLMMTSGWLFFLVKISVFAIIYSSVLFKWGLNESEKDLIFNLINKRRNEKKGS